MIRGNKRPLERQPALDFNFNASIHNRFDIEVRDSETGELKQQAKAENIILDALWTKIQGSPNSGWFNYVHYGSGQTTPSASDTSLTQFIASLSFSGSVYKWDPDTGVYSVRSSASISAADAVGKLIGEIGIASSTGSGTLMTKALLQDMNGNQISILKTDTDMINIYATVFVHVNPGGYQNGSCKVFCQDPERGLLRYLAGRYASITGNNSKLPVSFAYPSSSGLHELEGYNASLLVDYWDSLSNISDWSFSASTKQFTLPTKRIEVDRANVGGVYQLALYTNYLSHIQTPDIVLSTAPGGWFAGSDVVGEAIGTGDGSTVDFRTKFGYVQSPTIYVDGTPVNCTVDIDQPADAKRSFSGRMKALDKNMKPIAVIPNQMSANYSAYWENPYFETIGIESVYIQYANVSASQDGAKWTQVASNGRRDGPSHQSISEQYRNYRYWKMTGSGTNYGDGYLFAVHSTETRTTNIHFATPPAAGAVITADYHTPCIAKDENHVFDCSVTIQIGEYTED